MGFFAAKSCKFDMYVSLLRMVPLTCEVSNGAGFLKQVRDGNRIPHDSFRLNKCQKNSGNHSKLSVVSKSAVNISFSTEQRVKDSVLKQVNLLKGHSVTRKSNMEELNEAYARCRELCERCSRTFYLGTLVMDLERQRATWAIYAWGRRLDDLVDGRQNKSNITLEDLDRWELRLDDIFRGQPHDVYDAALSDSITKFPLDIQPFRDMIEGMRMDLIKFRYKNFDELYLYCYHVSATMGLMVLSVLGLAPESKATTESVCNGLVELGLGIQLTNILRDVGEDHRNWKRIYLPQDELAQAGLSDDDIYVGRVNDKWRDFMKKQIKRVRDLFDDGERVIAELNSDSRWPMWAAIVLNRQILEEIEANDYDNFTRSAIVGNRRKLFTLPIAYAKSLLPPSLPLY